MSRAAAGRYAGKFPAGKDHRSGPSLKPALTVDPQSSEGQRASNVVARVPNLTGDRKKAITALRSDTVTTPRSRDGNHHPERSDRGVRASSDLSCHSAVIVPAANAPAGLTSQRTMTPSVIGGMAAGQFTPAPFPSLMLTHAGESLSAGSCLGLRVDSQGNPSTRPRVRATPWGELRNLWPENYRARADELARILFPNSMVSGALTKRLRATIRAHEIRVLVEFSSKKTTPTSTAKAAEFWSTVLLTATQNDAIGLGNLQRRVCGTKTWEFTRADGKTQLVRWMCQSERCRHCSKHKTIKVQNRLVCQLAADAAELESASTYRGRPVFLTLTWDHAAIMEQHGVDESGARVLAWRLARRARARFIESLRGKTRTTTKDGVVIHRYRDGRYPDLQYFCRTELHKNGMPHLHMALISRELTRDMVGRHGSYSDFMRDHKKRLSRWRARCHDWESRGRPGRRPRVRVSFSKLRRELAELATSAGFGKAFWLEPMRSAAAAGRYLTKDSWAPAALAYELTKTSQTGRSDIAPVIPRGQRMVDTSRGFWTEPAYEPPEQPAVVSVTLHDAPFDIVKKHAESMGSTVELEQDQADMRGMDHPKPGENWPRQIVLASLSPPASGPPVRGMVTNE